MNLLLHVSFVAGIEGTVISKEEISNHNFIDFGDSL